MLYPNEKIITSFQHAFRVFKDYTNPKEMDPSKKKEKLKESEKMQKDCG